MSIIIDAIRQLFKKAATLKYPSEKKPVPEGFRGRPVWNIQKCIGCGLCERVCPSAAIELEGKGREGEIIHCVDRCMFCGQCAENCPRNAITMSEEYELAEYDKSKMVHEYRRKG